MLAVTNVRINPTPDTLWRYMELLEAELNDQAMAEQQRNTKRPLAHLADGTPVPIDANGAEGKGKNKGKDKKGGKGNPK
eukprot:3206901-Amphidinium_carterae.1